MKFQWNFKQQTELTDDDKTNVERMKEVNVNLTKQWKQHGDDAASLDRRGATYIYNGLRAELSHTCWRFRSGNIYGWIWTKFVMWLH